MYCAANVSNRFKNTKRVVLVNRGMTSGQDMTFYTSARLSAEQDAEQDAEPARQGLLPLELALCTPWALVTEPYTYTRKIAGTSTKSSHGEGQYDTGLKLLISSGRNFPTALATDGLNCTHATSIHFTACVASLSTLSSPTHSGQCTENKQRP